MCGTGLKMEIWKPLYFILIFSHGSDIWSISQGVFTVHKVTKVFRHKSSQSRCKGAHTDGETNHQ